MIHIILPVHNRKEITIRFIEQLKRQTYQDFSVILIDDSSPDYERMDLSNASDRILTINGNGGLWWAGSLQKAYNLLSNVDNDSLVMIANDDVIFADDFLEKNIAQFETGTILMPKVFVDNIQIDGGARVDWNPFSLGLNKDSNCCSTRCIILTTKDFIKIGKWHTKILPHYLSDTEWTFRANKKGLRIIEGESVKVLREEDETKSTKLFSKRNPYNPIYYSSFILLSCPVRHIFANLIRIWYRALRSFAIKILQRIIDVKINKPKGRWYSRGAWLTLTINTNCNLRCTDCPLWIGNDEFPQWKQYNIEDWKDFIINLPEWFSLFSICGGEPTLLKWLADFVNWLLDNGHHVSIYTNLYNVDELLKIKRSSRFIIIATYHHQDDKERFLRNYNLLKNKYRISVREFELPMKLPCSERIPHLKGSYTVKFNSYHCAPNAPITRAIYCGAEDKYEIKNKR